MKVPDDPEDDLADKSQWASEDFLNHGPPTTKAIPATQYQATVPAAKPAQPISPQVMSMNRLGDSGFGIMLFFFRAAGVDGLGGMVCKNPARLEFE